MTDTTALPAPHQAYEPPPTFLYRRDGSPLQADLGSVTLQDATVAFTLLEAPDGTRIYVSTSFLSVDASLGFNPEPLLWETVISGGPMHGTLLRHTSEQQAREAHTELLEQVQQAVDAFGWGLQPPADPLHEDVAEQGMADVAALP
jgi:hypothetical protein